LKKTRFCWQLALSRGGAFIIIWWILTEGAISSWLIGIPALFFAVAVSTALIPAVSFSWTEFFKFAPLFLYHSIIGAVDVARRVFQPTLPIAPDLIEYPLRLPPGLPIVFMTNIVCLLPGTLSVTFDNKVMKVHVLDRRKDFRTELRLVEESVMKIFNGTDSEFLKE